MSGSQMPTFELNPRDVALLRLLGVAPGDEAESQTDPSKLLDEVLTMYAADANTAVEEIKGLRAQVETWRERWGVMTGCAVVATIAALGELVLLIWRTQ